jgi:hypothetical protein
MFVFLCFIKLSAISRQRSAFIGWLLSPSKAQWKAWVINWVLASPSKR